MFNSFSEIDCELSDWQAGDCSVSCGPGARIKTRFKLVKEINGGAPCAGNLNQMESCNLKECPGNKKDVYMP